MRKKPETKTGISSGDAIRSAEQAKNEERVKEFILADPDDDPDKDYTTAWEQMLADMDRKSGNAPWDPPDPWNDAYDEITDEEEELLAWQLEMGLIDMPVPKNDNDKTFNTLVFKDHLLEYPQLYLQVAVLGPPADTRGFPAMFSRAMCWAAPTLEEADLAVFTGGADVDPLYYGEEPIGSCYYGDEERDYADIMSYLTCVNLGIPMLGVCRGAQFLAAMGGYKLVQDLDNHQTDHKIWDVRGHYYIDHASSLHHQSVIPGPGMDVLATATESTYKRLNPKTRLEKEKLGINHWSPDVEAFFIRDTCALGIQGHPEYKNYNAFTKWSLQLVEEFVLTNEDVDWELGRRRLKKEFREERLLMNGGKAKTQRPILGISSVKEG